MNAAVSRDDLVADGGAVLRSVHRKLTASGLPPAAAATYLAGWYGGAVAHLVGTSIAIDRAALIVDPSKVRFRLHPEGWPEHVDPAGSPTAGSADEDIRRAVHALVDFCEPLITACRAMAAVGRTGLWNEVGDRLAMALAYQVARPVDPSMVAMLEAAWGVPDTPWRARPRLGFARSSVLGTVHVAQKGGCCLSHTAPGDGRSPYCEHCPFRSPEACDAAQVAWLEQAHARLGDRSVA